jgi:hypothetical protein
MNMGLKIYRLSVIELVILLIYPEIPEISIKRFKPRTYKHYARTLPQCHIAFLNVAKDNRLPQTSRFEGMLEEHREGMPHGLHLC